MNIEKIIKAIEIGIENTARLKSRVATDVEEYGSKLTGHSSLDMLKRQLTELTEAKHELVSAHQGAKEPQ